MEVVNLRLDTDSIIFQLKKNESIDNTYNVIIRELPFTKNCDINDDTCLNSGTTYIRLGWYKIKNNKLELFKYVFLTTDFINQNNLDYLNTYIFGGNKKFFNLIDISRIIIKNPSEKLKPDNVYNLLCFISKNHKTFLSPNDVNNKILRLENCFSSSSSNYKNSKLSLFLLLAIIFSSIIVFIIFIIYLIYYLRKEKIFQ